MHRTPVDNRFHYVVLKLNIGTQEAIFCIHLQMSVHLNIEETIQPVLFACTRESNNTSQL